MTQQETHPPRQSTTCNCFCGGDRVSKSNYWKNSMFALYLLWGLSTFSCCPLSSAATALQTAAGFPIDFPGNCSQVKCPQVETCPEDSYRLPSLVTVKSRRQAADKSLAFSEEQMSHCCPSPSTQKKCQCIPDLLCEPKECAPGWTTHVSQNGTGKPGSCCPTFECVPALTTSDDGDTARHRSKHPPQKLHGDATAKKFDSDFSSPEDDSSSDSNDSEEDEALFTKDNHLGLPKDESYVEKGHCFHTGKIYKSGESWTVQPDCNECFCEQGLVSCKPISCNVPAECRLARAQPLSCCPVCDGCVSSSGKAYNMSETWQEDPCTNCTCQGGRIQCHTSSCKRQHSCENPKYFSGECCPRCENEAPDTGTVPHIFDKDSCPFRECHRDISCPNGFRLDKSGCPTCQCKKCVSLLGCKLSCSRGFKVDHFGCTMCQCRDDGEPFSSSSRHNNGKTHQKEISSSSSSLSTSGSLATFTKRIEDDHSSSSTSRYFPPVKVDERNLLGNFGGNSNKKDIIVGHPDAQQHHRQYPYHNTGNQNRQENHNDDSLYGYGYANSNEGSSSSADEMVLFCTMDSEGVRRMEGEEWSDNCRRCVCRNGREMCSLITCQPPKCEHPIFYPGHCCPRCPVEESSLPFNPANVSICLSSDGTERLEGEIWTLSNCLSCTCHKGQVLCSAPECPPTPCTSPKLVDCCLQCSSGTISSDNQQNFKDGQYNRINNWNENKASSSSESNCLSDDSIKIYLDGETWKVGACQSCRCEAGLITCFSAGRCPPMECSHPVLAKNQCCPICLEKIVHKSAIKEYHHGVEGALQRLHEQMNANNLQNHTTTTTASRDPRGGLEPHCAVLIACLLLVTIVLSLYIIRQVCFHRRVSRRLIKKLPVSFHSSSSCAHSLSVTPDCCYKCDYSKYCGEGGGCVVVGTGISSSGAGSKSRGGGDGCVGGGSNRGGISRASSSHGGSNGNLPSEQKPLFQQHNGNAAPIL